jgi:hypothetical protein
LPPSRMHAAGASAATTMSSAAAGLATHCPMGTGACARVRQQDPLTHEERWSGGAKRRSAAGPTTAHAAAQRRRWRAQRRGVHAQAAGVALAQDSTKSAMRLPGRAVRHARSISVRAARRARRTASGAARGAGGQCAAGGGACVARGARRPNVVGPLPREQTEGRAVVIPRRAEEGGGAAQLGAARAAARTLLCARAPAARWRSLGIP